MMQTRKAQEAAAREADRRSYLPPVAQRSTMTRTIAVRVDLPRMDGAWHFGPVSYDYGSQKLIVPLIEEAAPVVEAPTPLEVQGAVNDLRQEFTSALTLLAEEMRSLRAQMAADNIPTEVPVRSRRGAARAAIVAGASDTEEGVDAEPQ